MQIPPPELASWVSLVRDALTGCAALVGAVVAVIGLNAWHRQLKGKTDYELARRLLKAAYKVRDAIRSVRNPAIFEGEARAAQKEVEIDEPALKQNPNAARAFSVYQFRWKRLAEAMAELDAESFEAEISWGEGIKVKIREVRKLVHELRLAINSHIDAAAGMGRQPIASTESHRATLYDTCDLENPDVFTCRVQAAVSAIEDSLRPHLGSK
jgi:hypothetical protein